MNRCCRPLLLSVILGAGLITSCSMRPVNVESKWMEGMQRKQSFDNLLIVGLTPNYNLRCRFEQLMTAALRGEGVTATSSCALMQPEDPLTKEGITPSVVSTGANAVLVTELLTGEFNVVEGGDSETRSKGYYKPIAYGYAYQYPYYGGYGLPVTYVDFTAEQSEFTVERSVVIASNLYRTSDAELVYSMQVTAKNQKTRNDVLAVVKKGLVDRLHSEGLVPEVPGNN